jgi:hypothetical protein
MNDSGMITELEYLCSQEAFENWYISEMMYGYEHDDIQIKLWINDDGFYQDLTVQSVWRGWQAAADIAGLLINH